MTQVLMRDELWRWWFRESAMECRGYTSQGGGQTFFLPSTTGRPTRLALDKLQTTQERALLALLIAPARG